MRHPTRCSHRASCVELSTMSALRLAPPPACSGRVLLNFLSFVFGLLGGSLSPIVGLWVVVGDKKRGHTPPPMVGDGPKFYEAHKSCGGPLLAAPKDSLFLKFNLFNSLTASCCSLVVINYTWKRLPCWVEGEETTTWSKTIWWHFPRVLWTPMKDRLQQKHHKEAKKFLKRYAHLPDFLHHQPPRWNEPKAPVNLLGNHSLLNVLLPTKGEILSLNISSYWT